MSTKKLKVAFGVTVLSAGTAQGKLDGIGYYTQELARSLLNNNVDLNPISFGKFDISEYASKPVQQWSNYAYSTAISAITGRAFPRSVALRGKVDLFHATDHYIPKIKSVPLVATIMDAIPLAHPEWVNQRLRFLKNALWRSAAKWASHIITISEYSKSQLIEHFNLHPDKISVTPLGVDERYFERLPAEFVQSCLSRYNLPSKFFLFIGTLQPRKNLGLLVHAHSFLPNDIRQAFPLVIVGRPGWGDEDWGQLLGQKGIRWLQNVNDLDKRALLQAASILTFPSLSEGFGLPVLEAFASGVPVIASNTTSLPEVADNAAELVEPRDPEAWTAAMMKLVLNDDLRCHYISHGFQRAKCFTWQACAEATQEVYRRVLR